MANKGDFNRIAEAIVAEWERRKGSRKEWKKQWDEVDRQKAMHPDISYKRVNGDPAREIDPKKAWMPEIELPWQAGAMEVLMTDVNRFMFPDTGSFYRAKAVVTDEYFDRADFSSIVAGDENSVPTKFDQEAADKLAEGFGRHFQRQYKFREAWDKLNAQALSYGAFVGRGRMVKRRVAMLDAKGDIRHVERKIPMLIPKDIRQTYIDDRRWRLAGEGFEVSPLTIEESWALKDDLLKAASKGERDPQKENGGWMAENLRAAVPDKQGGLTVLRAEGDFVIPRKTVKSQLIQDATVTLVLGADHAVIRFQTKTPSSYIEHSYISEDVGSPYVHSPLLKGAKIQKAAGHALVMFLAWAQLNIRPPLSYPADDPGFSAMDGSEPNIAPGELWPTVGQVVPNQIGDGGALMNAYLVFAKQYEDVTGVNPARLGASTLSHTTAFAKSAEIERGSSRSVAYARSVANSPMTRWLHMEYEMGRQSLSGETTFYIPDYHGAVTVKRDTLPDDVEFEVFGSAAPQESQAKVQEQIQAMNIVLGMEEAKLQINPQARPLDVEAMQLELLGKIFPNAEKFLAGGTESLPDTVTPDPQLQQSIEGVSDPSVALLDALQ